MGSDKEDLRRWADLVLDGKPINIDQTIRQQAARIAELEATERELREAVKVLATYAHRRTLQAQKLDTMPYIKQQVFLGTVGQAKDAVLSNPIASAAVREASK